MTQDQLLNKLKEVAPKFYWYFDEGALRALPKKGVLQEGCTLCPITALTFALEGKMFPITEYYDAGHLIGLTKTLATSIVAAADYEKNVGSPTLRRKLLEAVGPFPHEGDANFT